MKKITLTLGVFVSTFFAADAQCTIDPSGVPPGLFADTTALPCVERGVAYDQTKQFKIPGTVNAQDFYPGIPFPVNITVDSVVVDSVSGVPDGIVATWNPETGVFYGGTNGCFNVAGTTDVPVGNYPITVHGTIAVSGIPANPLGIPSDTIFPLSMMSQMGGGNGPFDFALDVINPGDPCRPELSGVEALNSFNAIISAYPNPASTMLNLDINTVERINGTITVFDALGRNVYSEKADIKGLVKTQINVSSFVAGIYSLQITDAKRSYKTKFIVE